MACAVILTAIRIEYMAVRAYLSDLTEEMHPNGTIYERGKFSIGGQKWEVGIVETGAGNSPAGIEAERAIAYFKPDVILFVGVAGGIEDVQLGDVVAATKVYGYESGKVAETFRPRPDVGLSNYNMIQRAKAEARKTDWLARLSDSAKPSVFVAPIAAGEKVVANTESDLFKFLQQNYGDALAVEMEGRGILQAAHANQQVSALIIRGISDLIDGKSRADKEGFQEVAARHASAFAFQVLAKLGVSQENNSNSANNFLEKEPITPNFFAYDDAWVGRESLITKLSSDLRKSCRFLLILGLTGIGKTALAEKLVVELKDLIQSDFDKKLLRAKFDYNDKTKDFASVATIWLEGLGEVISPVHKKPELLLNQLVNRLENNQFMLLIDSMENLLEKSDDASWGDFTDEYWQRFFLRLLSAESCQTRLIVTSQDLPVNLHSKACRYPNFYQRQILYGLNESEQKALFKIEKLDISQKSEDRPILLRLGKVYKGHPLVLRVIIGEIKGNPFYGNVQAYWNDVGSKIQEVEKDLAEAEAGKIEGNDEWELHKLTRHFREQVNKNRIEAVFNRLETQVPDAHILICAASVYRIPVQEEGWLMQLAVLVKRVEKQVCSQKRQEQALEELLNRFLAEESLNHNNKRVLGQHNLVRSVALEKHRNLIEKLKAKVS
ncbi:phosphorylase [Okeania sp. SIO1I7]|uniref:phosphorylase family protein n=1 Tax=Okeania sp. SIO1I7 TaxID=2607772 RepID=UPI0013FC3BE0|nr:phosphorylase [Okeania sp. SIO1I7]NET26604.1 phosphorylase [Okeania sp. SIO1I7]